MWQILLVFLVWRVESLQSTSPVPKYLRYGSTQMEEIAGRLPIRWTSLMHRGQRTTALEHPWHVAIWLTPPGIDMRITCGGVLIDSMHVLTAAHCFGAYISNYVVSMGHDTKDATSLETQWMVIKTIHIHPSFFSNNKDRGDIALLELLEPVDITGDYVRAIGLKKMNFLQDQIPFDATVIGFGQSETETISTHLTSGQVSVLTRNECESDWTKIGGEVLITPDEICAHGTRVCGGDSGGSLVFQKDGVHYLIGLVSRGRENCSLQYASDLYVNVTYYLPWIEAIAQNIDRCSEGQGLLEHHPFFYLTLKWLWT